MTAKSRSRRSGTPASNSAPCRCSTALTCSLPVGDKRRSGFLIPNAKYSTTNYFEFYLPYYWNIAPNMDATITPHYIHKRGNIMWENEFRYLTQAGAGLMELDYLPSDKVYEDEHPTESNRHRWMYSTGSTPA